MKVIAKNFFNFVASNAPTTSGFREPLSFVGAFFVGKFETKGREYARVTPQANSN